MIELPFQKLLIWQKGVELTDAVYDITASFPKEELYGLTRQAREAAASVPANIAEGSQRTSMKEFRNFLRIAKGSLAELLTHMIIAKRRKYLSEEKYQMIERRIIELDKMLWSFIQKMTNR